jgi:hypothetical protein
MTISSIFRRRSSASATSEASTAATTSEASPGEVQDRLEKTLDLVFTMDCTGSMGSYIQAAKTNIQAIVKRLSEQENADLRFGLVAYRDHPPQDMSFITQTFPFTTTLAGMQKNLASLSAAGGGDGPEAVATALKSTLDMGWREEATKVCILIADAPPHGLGEANDGFPNGSPDGVDPLTVLDQMGERGICVYAVGCEPALGSYRYAREFMIAAAERTEGQAISLGSAASLADVIMGGAIEEMDLEKLMAEVGEEVLQLRKESPMMTDDMMQQKVCSKMQSRGHRTRQMKSPKLTSNYSDHHVSKAKCLSEARATLASAAPIPGKGRTMSPPAPPGYSPMSSHSKKKKSAAPIMRSSRMAAAPPGGGISFGAPLSMSHAESTKSSVDGASVDGAVELSEDTISMEQVTRMFNRGKKKGMY